MKIDEYRKLKKPKRSKYGNVKVGGNDSTKEHTRAVELRFMEKAGIISELKEQVQFVLIPAQYEVINGKRICLERACSYFADFTYIRDGVFIVNDTKPDRVKGKPDLRTEAYKIKKKLMLKVWGVKILET